MLKTPGCRVAGLLAWACLVAAAGCSKSREPERLWGEELVSKIDSLAEATIRTGRVAGLSIGVKRGDEVLLAKGYGYANIEDSIRATAETVYRIGSLTKQFTAAAILQLADIGALSLDGLVTDYLPDFPTQGYRVTIRHLLTHTSGIPFVGRRLSPAELALDVTDEELLALFQDRPFVSAPGERWSYNNNGYTLLGMIVESVSGMEYRDYIAGRVFRPIGLTGSSYCDNQPTAPGQASGYDRLYGRFVSPTYISMNHPGAAGALCSTVLDLLTWSSALRAGRVVSTEVFEQMITPAILERGDTVPYGFGVRLQPRNGQRVISHGGAIPGFVSYMAYYYESDLDVVVLSNTPGSHRHSIVHQVASWALDPQSEASSR